jgi:hypothetical protein
MSATKVTLRKNCITTFLIFNFSLFLFAKYYYYGSVSNLLILFRILFIIRYIILMIIQSMTLLIIPPNKMNF